MLSSRPISTSSSSTASASIRAPPVSSSPRPAGQISSAADLTASVRRTTGDRPPPLVGCSVTLVGEDEVYVFGGRLVPTRTMVATLYCLDLVTLEWRQVWPAKAVGETRADDDEPSPPGAFEGGSADEAHTFAPQARYFHSACAWQDKLVIFGGEGYGPTVPGTTHDTPSPENDPTLALKTLDDVCIWDTKAGKWLDGATTCKEGVERPAARYAHLGVVTSVKVEEGEGETSEAREKAAVLVMGGQDVRNTYLHSMNVLDLDSMTWIQASNWDRHIGTYRAVATCPRYSVIPTTISESVPASSSEAVDDVQRAVRGERGPEKALGLNEGESLIQLAHSTLPPASDPEPLILFSNFNFTQVRRDLDLLASPLSPSNALEATSLSSSFSGTSLPPGLRFPTGAIVGRHLLVFGTFLSSAINNFSIWALDLGPGGAKGVKERIEKGEKLEWTRVDPGSVLAKGSWNRAVSWRNSVVVLGDRERDIASDYDHRQTNFAHVALIDLESFGIYQPPPQSLPPIAQSFGLLTLAQPYLSDFEIICSDGKRLACSRQVLTERWPWFAAKMDEFKVRASAVQAAQQLGKTQPAENGATTDAASSTAADDLRLMPRTLDLPEASSVVQAFLQYLYTLTLCTHLQLHPPVLAALAIFSRTYEDDALWALCVHALHGVLEKEAQAAPLVYEAATMSGSTALQIRALRTMLSNPAVRMRQSPRPPSQPQDVSASPPPAASFAPVATMPAVQSATEGRQRAPPAKLHSLTAGSPTSRISLQLASPLRSPRSPRFLDDLPSSPAPTSPLPLPPTPPAPAFSVPDSDTRDSQSLRSKSSKPPSDTVADPTPDEVAPIPVPQWSPFAPDPTLSPRLASGFFGTSLSSDSVLAPSPPSFFSHGLPNSPTRSTRSYPHPSSTRSRSDSIGQRSIASTSSSCPTGLSGWTNPLEPQLEEDEDGLNAATNLSGAMTSIGRSFILQREARKPMGALPLEASTTPHLASSFITATPTSRQGMTAESSGPKGETHWAPSFFDTVKGDGSVRNPLSSRKATQISQDLLAQLDLDRLVEQSSMPAVAVSPPVAVAAPAVHQYFDNPRPAPTPSPSPRLHHDSSVRPTTASKTMPGLLPAVLSLPSRRHPLDPDTPSHQAATASPGPSTPGRGSKSRPSTASTGSGASIAMSSGPSSSGESAYSTDDVLTPPTPSLGLPPLSPKGMHALHSLPGLQQPDGVLLYRRPSLPAAPSATLTATATSGHKRASLSSRLSSKPLSKKEERQTLELSVGRKVLEAAGASETEIRLRARSVGHQVLKQREEEAKHGGKNSVALGDYMGGAQLSSKFSIG